MSIHGRDGSENLCDQHHGPATGILGCPTVSLTAFKLLRTTYKAGKETRDLCQSQTNRQSMKYSSIKGKEEGSEEGDLYYIFTLNGIIED